MSVAYSILRDVYIAVTTLEGVFLWQSNPLTNLIMELVFRIFSTGGVAVFGYDIPTPANKRRHKLVDQTKNNSPKTETRKRVFVENAQVLSDEQRQSLSENEKSYEETCSDKGVWLELFCPDDACFTEEERVRIPVFCEDPKIKKKLWLDIFCPGESCEVDEASKLP